VSLQEQNRSTDKQLLFQLISCSKCCPLARTHALSLGRHWSTALSITLSSAFKFLQGSVATLFRWVSVTGRAPAYTSAEGMLTSLFCGQISSLWYYFVNALCPVERNLCWPTSPALYVCPAPINSVVFRFAIDKRPCYHNQKYQCFYCFRLFLFYFNDCTSVDRFLLMSVY